MQLRPAQPEDALAVARVHVRSWQVGYRGLLPDEYLDQLRPEDRAEKYDFASLDPLKPQTFVALERGTIHGFATAAPSRDQSLTGYGELYALYVDPEQWGCGIGVALIAAARAHLMECGFREAMLWMLAGNVRAARFYQSDGWASDGHHRTETLWGITVEEIRYVRSLLTK